MSTLTWDQATVPVRPSVGMRLTTRGRVALGAVALVAAGAAILGTGSAAASGPAAPVAVESVTVHAGQTLWQLAGPIVRPGEDIREVVDRLMELNGLDAAGLVVGQRILLPVLD